MALAWQVLDKLGHQMLVWLIERAIFVDISVRGAHHGDCLLNEFFAKRRIVLLP